MLDIFWPRYKLEESIEYMSTTLIENNYKNAT